MKVLLFANTDWYLYNFRLSLAERLRAEGFETVLVSPPGPYGARLEALGFKWLAAPMNRRGLNPWRELGLVLWLARLIARERPDVVHGFTIKSAIYGSLAGRLAGARMRVLSITGLGYVFISDELRARILRPLVRALMRLAFCGDGVRVILQNQEDVALFERTRLVDRSRVWLIKGSGVDCARFQVPPDHVPNARPFTVVLAARMLWDKGVAEYVEASRILKAKGSDIRFVLAGTPDPGNPASVSEADVETWKSSSLVEYLGHVEDMPTLLMNADIVALPSYREGLPKTLIEAAACARPLITSDVPGCREVVTHELDGLLVPVKNAAALAEAIDRLHQDPALARRLGLAAREKALIEFTQDVVLQKTLAIYAEAQR